MEGHRSLNPGPVSLVLSGGAARGGFHLGAIKALQEAGFEIKAISGSSIGAIIGAGISAGLTPDALLEIFTSKELRRVFRFHLFGEGIFKVDPSRPVIRKLAPLARLEDYPIPLFVTAVEAETGAIRRFHQGDAVTILLASAAIAPLFEPITYQGVKLIDGGIGDNLPIEPLLDFPYPIIGINLLPNIPKKTHWIGGIITRSLFLAWHSTIRHQIEQCDLYLAPAELSELRMFGFRDIRKGYELGYRTTKKRLGSLTA